MKTVTNIFKTYRDKWFHFIAGFIIESLALLLVWRIYKTFNFQIDILFTLLTPLIIGCMKEMWDKYVKGTLFDPADWACTFAGGMVAFIIYILIILS